LQLSGHFLKRERIGAFFRNKIEISDNKLIFKKPEELTNPSLHMIPCYSISQFATCCNSKPCSFLVIFRPENDEVVRMQLLS